MTSGGISGAAPCLAVKLGAKALAIGPTLRGVTARKFLWLAFASALISTVLQQARGFVCGQTANVLQRAVSMAVGDWAGSVLVMYAAGFLLHSAARRLSGR